MNYELKDCDILEGKIPSDLSGVYFRNGPNQKYLQRSGRTHWFEGDGMIHAVRILNGKANYCNRYQETPKFHRETKAGYATDMRLGEFNGNGGLFRFLLRRFMH